jgi:hypothetical protein
VVVATAASAVVAAVTTSAAMVATAVVATNRASQIGYGAGISQPHIFYEQIKREPLRDSSEWFHNQYETIIAY